MRPHKVHIDPGKAYLGETYIWCECASPDGMSPAGKVAVKNEDPVFRGTSRDELTAWLDLHPDAAPAIPRPRRKGRMELPSHIDAGKWKDPLTSLERWFTRLPNTEIENECHCRSGKPVVYWSPEDGTGCEDCSGSFFVYIPHAVMYNIMDKFGFPQELQRAIYDQVNPEGK